MLIFTIEDELPLLKASERMIKEAAPNADVKAFEDAEEALKAIMDGRLYPNIVFSDIEMPGMDGLEFAVRLKSIAPDARLVFVTGFSQYAVDAFKVKAQGYILKPITSEAVKEEIAYMPQPHRPSQDKLTVRCFGHFQVFWQDEPLIFRRKQTKELLAFLVDREGATCTTEEIGNSLWENEPTSKNISQRVRNLISDLKSTLHEIGMDDVLIRSRQKIAIRMDLLDCDYYRMLAGDMDAVNSFRGEYMIDYSWAEMTAGELFFSDNQD